MSDKLADNPIRMRLTMLLYRVTDISYTLTMHGSFNALIKRFLGNFQQLTDFLINLTYTKRICRISTKTIHVSTTINRNDITLFQHHITRNPMYHLFINRCTYRSRKRRTIRIGETFKRRNRPVISYELFSYLVKLPRRNPWLDSFGDFRQSLPYQKVTLPEQLNFIIRLKKYHLPLINKRQYLHYAP